MPLAGARGATRVDPEVEPIDEVVAQQRLDEVARCPRAPIRSWRALSCGDLLSAASPSRMVVPAQSAFRSVREATYRGRSLISRVNGPSRLVRPEGREDVVRPAAEQVARPQVCELLVHPIAGGGVGHRRLPAPVLEAVLAVLVAPAGCLHDAVEGHERGDDEFSHAAGTSRLRRTHRDLSRLRAGSRAGRRAGR